MLTVQKPAVWSILNRIGLFLRDIPKLSNNYEQHATFKKLAFSSREPEPLNYMSGRFRFMPFLDRELPVEPKLTVFEPSTCLLRPLKVYDICHFGMYLKSRPISFNKTVFYLTRQVSFSTKNTSSTFSFYLSLTLPVVH